MQLDPLFFTAGETNGTCLSDITILLLNMLCAFDAGMNGIDKEECESIGCCWAPENVMCIHIKFIRPAVGTGQVYFPRQGPGYNYEAGYDLARYNLAKLGRVRCS